jgi:tRNA A37 threonylcarbamoyladenosine synthetase subunit TsaC/SUA5/YrdC
MARILALNERGLREAVAALRRGQPVFLPNADPCYVVAASSAAAVNEAKRRPRGQAVGSWLPDPRSLLRSTAVSELARRRIAHCLQVEGLTVLVPVDETERLDPRLEPSYAEGAVLLYSAHLPQVRPLLEALPWLYTSSGNRTGVAPVQSLQALLEAYRLDDEDLIVVEGDRLERGPGPHASTTMLRFQADGDFEVVRPGIQDQRMRPSHDDVAGGLARYQAALRARLRALG